MSEMSRWAKYKEKNGVTPLDMLNPKTKPAPLDVIENRLAICSACPQLWVSTYQCKECGCFMKAKTKLLDAKCPIGKW